MGIVDRYHRKGSKCIRNAIKEDVISMPHLISATLSNKAYEVYCKWKTKREASAKISLAMCELDSIQELNAALSTQLNIHKARWKWLNENLQREMDLKECTGEKILNLSTQHDHLYYRRE